MITVGPTPSVSSAKSFIGAEIEISELDILGESLGRENCFGAAKGRVAPGEMTYFRMATMDTDGWIHAYLGEGEFTDDPFPIDGGVAVCHIANLQDLLEHILKNKFEHYVVMVRGKWNAVIQVKPHLGPGSRRGPTGLMTRSICWNRSGRRLPQSHHVEVGIG
jgi:L-fucose isomerase-like protein